MTAAMIGTPDFEAWRACDATPETMSASIALANAGFPNVLVYEDGAKICVRDWTRDKYRYADAYDILRREGDRWVMMAHFDRDRFDDEDRARIVAAANGEVA